MLGNGIVQSSIAMAWYSNASQRHSEEQQSKGDVLNSRDWQWQGHVEIGIATAWW